MLESRFFYRDDIEWSNNIMIPKAFILNEEYKNVSAETKIMYGLLIDRMQVSLQNDWTDKEGRCFLVYTIKEIQEIFGLSKPIAIRILKELETLNLLEKKRLGLRRTNLLYVKKIDFGKIKSTYKRENKNTYFPIK